MPEWLRRLSAGAALLALLYALTRVPWGGGVRAPAVPPAEPVKLSVQGGQAPVTLEKAEGAWRLVRPVQGPADQETVRQALTGLRDLAFESVVTERAESHGQYELEEGKAVRLSAWAAASDRAFEIWLGKDAGFTGRAYARLPGTPAVNLVSGLSRGTVDLPLVRWRDRRLFHTLDVARVDVVRGKDAFTLAESSHGWTVDGAPADEAKASSFISALRTLSADDLVDPPAALDLKARGLDKPSVSFTVHFSSGAPVTLLCGAGDPRPVRREGVEVLYLVPAYRFTPLDVSRKDLLAAR